MSRSWVVALVIGLGLLAGALVVDHHWAWLVHLTRWEKVLVVGLEVLGTAMTVVAVRRIVDPELPVPILLWVVVGIIWVLSLFSDSRNNDDSTRTSSGSSRDGTERMGLAWAIVATLGSLVVYAAGVGLAYGWGSGRLVGDAPKHKPAPPPAPTQPAPPPAPAPPPPDILASHDLAAAIAFARPHLTDTRDAPSAGAVQLARYAAAKLAWTDLAIAKNETSLELVEKDPMAEAGKRLCVAGVLARIEKLAVGGVDLHAARLVTATGDNLEAFATGDTGDLVKRKQAKFCGVVTGRFDAGGKPATFAVGMLK